MFRKSKSLLKEPDNQISKQIIDKFNSNKNLFDNRLPYQLKGELLPRSKINPFKKTPLRVIYDHEDFATFVLPSRRSIINHSKLKN